MKTFTNFLTNVFLFISIFITSFIISTFAWEGLRLLNVVDLTIQQDFGMTFIIMGTYFLLRFFKTSFL